MAFHTSVAVGHADPIWQRVDSSTAATLCGKSVAIVRNDRDLSVSVELSDAEESIEKWK
jgi:hypothetical protein